MSKTLTPTALANLTAHDAFNIHFDYDGAVVQFQNGYKPVIAPFTVTFDDNGVTVTVHSEEHGPFEILSPKYNNLYMHNLESVTFINV